VPVAPAGRSPEAASVPAVHSPEAVAARQKAVLQGSMSAVARQQQANVTTYVVDHSYAGTSERFR
jgi:hypothetical protein